MRTVHLSICGLVVILFLAVWNVGQAQDSLGMRCLTTLEYWASATGIQMVDSLAYMCSGYLGLRIMDLSDPANPVEIGRSPWNRWDYLSCGVYVNDNLAYITYLNDGSVLDISDPANPREIHHWNLVYSPVIVFVHGDVAVGVNEEEYPRIMDISDWNNVQIISLFPGLAGPSQPVGMVGNYLCLAGWGVEMYDISDSTNPVLVAVVDDTVYTGWSAKLSGNYVYLSTVSNGVRIYDVSDPLHPVAVAVCDTGYGCGDITISASHLFISEGPNLHIWDITDPTNPVFTDEYPLPLAEPTSWIASSGNLLCAALDFSEDQAVAVLDISNPATPVEVSRFGKRGNLRRMVINGTTGYLSDLIAGFRMIDLTDPSRAIELGRPFGSIGLDDIAVRGDYLYGVDYNYGLITFSVANPANPESLNCWQNVGHFHPTAITIVGDYAWVNSYIFSLANPASPVFVDSSSVIGSNFRAANGYVYSVAHRYFFIYNASNPAMPELTGSCTMPFYWGGTAKDLAIAGDYAYVAYYAGGVQIIDIANPTDPIVVGSVGGNWVTAVAASGNTMAFYQIASNYQQSMIYIMDLTDPIHPQYVGHYNIFEDMSDMEIYDSYLLTVSPNKFAVYQVDALSGVKTPEVVPHEFALYPCYPNPFNPSTVIRFSLPYTGHAKVIVYDVTGRQVEMLANGILCAGEHYVTFNGSKLSSGVYFIRLETSHRHQMEKAVLLK